jgi:hypothetical protein
MSETLPMSSQGTRLSDAVADRDPHSDGDPAPATSLPTETETETPAEESTETLTPETQTTTRATTDAERRGARRLERAERDPTEVVSAVTDEFGSGLTDATAASIEFEKSEYALQVALAEAQDEYVDTTCLHVRGRPRGALVEVVRADRRGCSLCRSGP